MSNHPSKSLNVIYRYGEVMQEVWYSQGMELVEALVELVQKRAHDVIEGKGGWTKY